MVPPAHLEDPSHVTPGRLVVGPFDPELQLRVLIRRAERSDRRDAAVDDRAFEQIKSFVSLFNAPG